MNYEQKYKDALDAAKHIYNDMKSGGNFGGMEDLEVIFPELRESEDERIRKAIIDALYSHTNSINVLSSKGYSMDDVIVYLEKQKDASKAIEAVDRIDKYIDEHLANAHDMKDSNPDKKYYRGWDDALGKMAGILQDVYSDEKQKEQKPAVEQLDGTFTSYDMAKTFTEGQNYVIAHPEKFGLCKPEEWSEEDRMETINVFRPLAGTSIESATKQAVNKFTNSGKKFLLAFNGVFILIDNTKSVQDIVSEYNRSLGGKKKEQGQSEGEPNDFEITLNDCMLAAQQYPPGKIGWDEVKMWAEELSNYCPQPNQKWSEFDWHCLERAIWYVENPAPNVVKDTNLVLWLKSLRPQPKEEWSEEDEDHFKACVRAMRTYQGNDTPISKWIEALKDRVCRQPHWKPSEEQMKALKYAAYHMLPGEEYRDVLFSLFKDLGKLM